MSFLIILLIAAIVLDITALRWGCDSTDDIDSPEWERRRQWAAAHRTSVGQPQFVRNVHLN